jgi:hypothetical protein
MSRMASRAGCEPPSFCRGKRIGQAFFNTLFTMDLWYDLTTFIHLAFVGSKNGSYVVTVVLYSLFEPLDITNLFIRTGYCLEDIPEHSHLFNLMFEFFMLMFNVYVLTTCALAGFLDRLFFCDVPGSQAGCSVRSVPCRR